MSLAGTNTFRKTKIHAERLFLCKNMTFEYRVKFPKTEKTSSCLTLSESQQELSARLSFMFYSNEKQELNYRPSWSILNIQTDFNEGGRRTAWLGFSVKTATPKTKQKNPAKCRVQCKLITFMGNLITVTPIGSNCHLIRGTLPSPNRLSP